MQQITHFYNSSKNNIEKCNKINSLTKNNSKKILEELVMHL